MFPLHIWLPDAMEGPTPVSALIHAATMVVAGVYLVARMFPLFIGYAPEVLHWTAYIGAFTALYAAVVACVQSDIKRVLAFSTISQIGFMIVSLGVCTSADPQRAGWATWPRCSTSSPMPCSRRCSSSGRAASSTPCTRTRCRPWADCGATCP
ncbi:membrane protein containing NADH:ubiquinone/plastoquinone oxidoreductase domain protein [human gut metagenome]|uniref:Membrane protein containing NADH:ubiquinone/plastoquinone oxidoreductase domain protein n=1 Tax=human gut metagenome TaxID=408170 RepID=K1TRY6_9ZZZZ